MDDKQDGGFACPICGKDTPHKHSQFEIRRYRQKQEERNGRG